MLFIKDLLLINVKIYAFYFEFCDAPSESEMIGLSQMAVVCCLVFRVWKQSIVCAHSHSGVFTDAVYQSTYPSEWRQWLNDLNNED